MSNTVDVTFVFLPSNLAERLNAGDVACRIYTYDRAATCRLITKTRMLSGERQHAEMVFPQQAPAWVRKGLTIRVRRSPGNEPLGAAIVQNVMAPGPGNPQRW